jgi:hypothetical protein
MPDEDYPPLMWVSEGLKDPLQNADEDRRTAERRVSSNPKSAYGNAKLPLHLWPEEATAAGCLGMLEGVLKYGIDNYIAGEGIVASEYVAACKRHIDLWFAGQDSAIDTNNPHLGNALACLAIIVKAQAHDLLIDDRRYEPNPGAYQRLVDKLTPQVTHLKQLFKDKLPKQWTRADNKVPSDGQ